MTRFVDVVISNDGTKDWFVEFEFDNEAEAREFYRIAQICKDVEDELLLYGDGVLRTLNKRDSNAKRRNKTKTKRRMVR